MSTAEIDKENPSALYGSTKGHLKLSNLKSDKASSTQIGVDLIGHKPNVLSTPKVLLEKQLNTQNLTKTGRKALGDVLNTTTKKSLAMGATPKMNKILPAELNNTAKCGKNHAKEANLSSKAAEISSEQEYGPVDPFVGSKYDNFGDLFEEGKLSDLFLGKSVSFFPQMPNGSVDPSQFKDELADLNLMSDKKWKHQLKRLGKNQRRNSMQLDDLLQEQPGLDSLIPPILEDD